MKALPFYINKFNHFFYSDSDLYPPSYAVGHPTVLQFFSTRSGREASAEYSITSSSSSCHRKQELALRQNVFSFFEIRRKLNGAVALSILRK